MVFPEGTHSTGNTDVYFAAPFIVFRFLAGPDFTGLLWIYRVAVAGITFDDFTPEPFPVPFNNITFIIMENVTIHVYN